MTTPSWPPPAIRPRRSWKRPRKKYKGKYILAVEGNPPLNEDGMFCIDGGKPFVEKLKWMAEDAMAIIAWGACASWGCVQAAKPNPTQADADRQGDPATSRSSRCRAARRSPR